MVVMSHVMLRNNVRLAHQSRPGQADRLSEDSGSGNMASSTWPCSFKLLAYAGDGIVDSEWLLKHS